MLISRFNKCSTNVKLTLFKSFCMSVYDVALWNYFSVSVFNKFIPAITNVSRNCLVFKNLIVCLAFSLICVYRLLTLLFIMLVFCLISCLWRMDRGSMGSRGSIDPPTIWGGGQGMMFDPPTFSSQRSSLLLHYWRRLAYCKKKPVICICVCRGKLKKT